MKKLLYIFSFLFCLSANAQDIIWLSPNEHDFGEMERYHEQSVDFEFKNNSGEAIVIDNVRTPCGCTTPEWSEEPIPADSTGIITITYDARKVGYFYKKVKVYFSGIRKGQKLYVEGEVVDEK